MRILVVEDEPGIATALERGLTADGFTVDVTDNGMDGLHLAQTNPYAAIVLDIMLPGMNGYKVCQELRRVENWTPIVMLTAKDGEYDEMEGLDTGADDYVTKPFRYPVLLSRIRAVIRRSEPGRAAAAEVSVGDLVLSPATQTLTRNGTELELSPRALSVLEYLMRQEDLVVSKEQIIANVWDHAFDGDPNIVEVYVSRIRSAIAADDQIVTLKTVRGVGYRLQSARS